MARRVAFFRTEGRTEGIYFTKCHCRNLALKLARNAKRRLFAEKVVCVILFFRFVFVAVPYCCNLEHFARTLAVGSGYKGRMHIYKAAALEKFVYRGRNHRTHPEHGVKRIRSYP